MSRDGFRALTEAAKERATVLARAANEAYQDSQHARAARLYEQAVAFAESAGDIGAAVKYRQMCGSTLELAGLMRRALAVMAPALSRGMTSGTEAESADLFNVLVSYADVSLKLPVRLPTIERALAQVETFLRDAGRTTWDHNILFLRAKLLSYRGQDAEALRTGQEAWTRWRNEHPFFNADSHLFRIVDYSLGARSAERARRCLMVWAEAPNDMPKLREVTLNRARSRLARFESRWSDALTFARRLGSACEQVDHAAVRIAGHIEMARALICAGDTVNARWAVARAVKCRGVESGHDRYAARILLV